MTLWQDPPPQTRRQARELERAAAARKAEDGSRSRRAGTTTPTVAGDVPSVSTASGSSPSGSSSGQAALYRGAPDTSRPEPVTAPVTMVPPPPSTAPDSAHGPGQEHTLTRRELRAMLQAQAANQVPTIEPDEATLTSEEPAVQVSDPETVVAEVISDDAVAEDAEAAAPVRVVPTQPSVPHEVAAHPFTDILTPHTVAEPAQDDAPVEQAEVNGGPTGEATDTGSQRAFTPPTGHWSIAAAEEDDDVDDPVNDTGGYARSRVASGSVTTANALILPSIPSVADATGPLTSTGEILVTGSIDLPRSLGATGQHPDRFDSADIDNLLENPEAAQAASDAAPIRASRAISSNTSTRDVITPRRRGAGSKLPVILAVTAAVLALGVIGLLVAGYVFHAF